MFVFISNIKNYNYALISSFHLRVLVRNGVPKLITLFFSLTKLYVLLYKVINFTSKTSNSEHISLKK